MFEKACIATFSTNLSLQGSKQLSILPYTITQNVKIYELHILATL